MSSKVLAMVFPGQGSQSVGMLAELATQFPEVKALFEEASQVLHYDLWELVQNDPEQKLDQTTYTQPALLVADVAVWRCWLSQGGPRPSLLAGHSLGEYSALVCAEALKFSEAVKLVSLRGKYMQEAVSPGEGAMAAIVGLDMPTLVELCADASHHGVVSPANYNSIGQTVVAGQTAAVERVVKEALAQGARLAKILPVSVPSHCALMQSAADHLKRSLEAVSLSTPKIPVVQNADVGIHDDPERIRALLVEQLISPVRWVETIQLFAQKGIQLIIECGPSKVLTGLNKRIEPIPTIPVNDSASLAGALAECSTRGD